MHVLFFFVLFCNHLDHDIQASDHHHHPHHVHHQKQDLITTTSTTASSTTNLSLDDDTRLRNKIGYQSTQIDKLKQVISPSLLNQVLDKSSFPTLLPLSSLFFFVCNQNRVTFVFDRTT